MFRIIFADRSHDEMWDDFVTNQSVNGTFLHTRRFLNYHPEDRFRDCSLLLHYDSHLAAVCPANLLEKEGKKIFLSHQGSTYGGLVIAKRYYKAKYVVAMVAELKEFLRKHGFGEAYLKLTPDILSEDSALLEFACYYHGFSEYKEINPYIDYEYYKEPVIRNFSQGKKTHVHNCERENVTIRPLQSEEEIGEYYDILCKNLKKYDLAPVHSLAELLDLKYNRLKNECEFFGAYLDGTMVAGGLMFYFQKAMVAHTQYLSARSEYASLSPMTYLYYWIIKTMKERGYRKLSWGICTEERGRILNFGLLNNKEAYGSMHSNNHTCYIQL